MDMPNHDDFCRAIDQFTPEVFDLIRRFNSFIAECALAANRQVLADPSGSGLDEATRYLSAMANANQAQATAMQVLVTAILQATDERVRARQIDRFVTVTNLMIDGWYDQLPGLVAEVSF